jgi:hypothetical protein
MLCGFVLLIGCHYGSPTLLAKGLRFSCYSFKTVIVFTVINNKFSGVLISRVYTKISWSVRKMFALVLI